MPMLDGLQLNTVWSDYFTYGEDKTKMLVFAHASSLMPRNDQRHGHYHSRESL